MKYRGILLSLPLALAAHARGPANLLESLPAWFDLNDSQFAVSSAFVSRGAAGTLAVEGNRASFHAAGRALALRWDGANPASAPEGRAPMRARCSYFLGADRGQW